MSLVILYNLGSKEFLQGGEKFTFTEEERRQRQLDAYRRFHQSPKGKIATYNWNNCEQGKKRFKTYRVKHRELIAKNTHERCSKQNYIIQKEWNKNNRERLREIQRKHEQKPERIAYRKEWLKNNIDKSLEWSNTYINKLIKKAGLENVISTEAFRWALQNWGSAIRRRDKICQNCGSVKKLNAHHIFYKIFYPALALNKNNGITLCEKCHDEVHLRKRKGELARP